MTSEQPKKIILYLFIFLVSIVPLVFFWRSEELFEFNKMMVTYAITAAIGFVWLGRMVLEKRVIFSRSKLDIPLALFVFSQFLATIFSMHPRTSWLGYYTRFHGGFLSTLTYVFLYYAFISNLGKKHLKSTLLAIFSAALLVSAYAIPEHFGHSPSCLLISGEFNASCWVQDVQSRVFGTFGQPNWLAAYAVTLIPLGLGLFLTSESGKDDLSKLIKWGYLVTSVLLMMTLIFTQSRSGVLGLGAGLILMASGLGLVLWKNRSRQLALQVLIAVFALLGVGLIWGTPFSPSIGQFLSSKTAEVSQPESDSSQTPTPAVNRLEVGGTDSGEIRKIVWQGAVDVWKRYPLLGSGVETFAYSYYQDRPAEHNLVSEWDFLYNKAHNEFLNYLATTGIVGLSSYVLLLAWFSFLVVFLVVKEVHPVLSKSKLTTSQTKSIILGTGLLSGIAAQSVSNFFGFSTVMITVLMFLFFAFWEVITRDDQEVKNHKLKLEGFQYLGLGVLTIAFLICLATVYNWWRSDLEFAQGKALINSGQLVAGSLKLKDATQLSPNEAVFHDELGIAYARLSLAFAAEDQATQAAQLAQAALDANDTALTLNDVHLNFYKSRARIALLLAQANLTFLDVAKIALNQAIDRSPTEAKLWYNLGLVEYSLGDLEVARDKLETAVELKPNYDSARLRLGEVYEDLGQPEAAKNQYNYILDFLSPGNTIVQEKIDNLETNSEAN